LFCIRTKSQEPRVKIFFFSHPGSWFLTLYSTSTHAQS